ncbi:L-fuconate dehydratase [Arthrobacter sp. BB-1]|uniref:L-fuconate dehydratase n=1 Tax=unclassified Arthrobacter TaxID=235627 RepID=UPI0010D8D823|nr:MULTISPECIES: L-fuconate dehydratase [unclassified Arthrobacter]TNB74588.1 L-fuconate dehydratase [Arthrobacter sp. BB-1]VII94937.1 L-fuconate dehydratase (EC 4.2.1.68) [Arthrobacter sp. DR-2P]
MPHITGYDVFDVRFPTSLTADGSDAMNHDADYSAAYIVLTTDDPAVYGCGFTFTIGRGNEVCAAAMELRARPLLGRDIDAVCGGLGETYRGLKQDSQLRWLGPDKGVEHLALGAVMNAVWDLAARRAGKPLWRLLVDMPAEDIVDAADLTYLSDALSREEALEILARLAPSRRGRMQQLTESGYPCYTTSAGWLGYSDEKLRRLCQEAVDQGYRHIKLKVGASLEDDIRRLRIAREVIGPQGNLMIDANQVWDVPQAIDWVKQLAEFNPLWIEEPTSPDDVLGHAEIRRAVQPIGVATGEHGMNRVLFKQLFQAGAVDYCQLDACRLASVNEVLAVQLMAAKFGIPVCPHAGGVGLCELVQHLSIFDFIAISGDLTGRVTEFVDHLHEHFVDPCIIRDGAYIMPANPGYSAELKVQTLQDYAFPWGNYWTGTDAGRAEQAWRAGSAERGVAFAAGRARAGA